MSWAFTNGPGEWGSIPGRVIPKTQNIVLDAALLNTQHYKVRIKGYVEQSMDWSRALLHTSVVAIEKGAFGSPSTKVTNSTYSLYVQWTTPTLQKVFDLRLRLQIRTLTTYVSTTNTYDLRYLRRLTLTIYVMTTLTDNLCFDDAHLRPLLLLETLMTYVTYNDSHLRSLLWLRTLPTYVLTTPTYNQCFDFKILWPIFLMTTLIYDLYYLRWHTSFVTYDDS